MATVKLFMDLWDQIRLKDCHDTEHGVEVYAETLYEAVLRGLNRLADVGWESKANETV